ncbi:MAG: UDP-N-acetylmuramoyl-L-alanine--D-glutamate ligase [Candidatus Omnitrophica bacterium]|nr:UDP-N-acetylmuramoyl-L-alanine--D-glutamate ligase [Candidatus Omnitrophota bacterium]
MIALGKKAAILGMGISGVQTALFLKQHGFEVFVSEMRSNAETQELNQQLHSQGIETELGRHSLEKILLSDWVMISPGISPFTDIYRDLGRYQKPILSEIEVASRFCVSRKIIAITGTAGKTTAATIITEWLQNNNQPVISCGNIGNPWIGELARITPQHFVVIEVSSFQLFSCSQFHPQIGILLNISPNHLDWHGTQEEYVLSKLKLFHNQDVEDLAVFQSRDRKGYFPQQYFQAQTVEFDREENLPGIERVLRILARFLKFPENTVDKTIAEFKGIEHRLEQVAVHRGVTFVNDSKCTTPLSLAYALERYADQQVILLAGGRAKSSDFDILKPLLQKKVKQAFVFGESAERIYEAWKGACPMMAVNDLSEAFHQAAGLAAAGDQILLSPACASFDQFKNYQARGIFFKEKVFEWADKSLRSIHAS